MKLVNAKIYEDEIRKKMWEIWYDEKYQYYFGGRWRRDFSLNDDKSDYPRMAFAVLNNKDELIGYINYFVDDITNVAQWFGAINFSNDKYTFGKALNQVIIDCFLKYGMEVLEWSVFIGNPIEKSYDKLCKKFGGHIVGIRHKRAQTLSGKTCDDKVYEILREDFLNAYNKKKIS